MRLRTALLTRAPGSLLGMVLLLAPKSAPAGLGAECRSRFEALMDRITLPQLPADRTSVEDWLESARPLQQSRIARDEQALEVTGRRRTAISAEKQQSLEKEFHSTSRELSAPSSTHRPQLFLDHLRAASGMLEAAGVPHRVRTPSRSSGGILAAGALEIVIDRGDRSDLSRLATGLDRLLPGAELVYDPELAARRGFVAGFRPGRTGLLDARKPTVFAPASSLSEGISGSLALRHELQHAYYEHLRLHGKPLQWMHGSYVNTSRSPFLPSVFDADETYRQYLSFEEVATHRQDLLVRLRRLVRGAASETDLQELTARIPQVSELSAKLQRLSELLRTALAGIPPGAAASREASWPIQFRGAPLQVRMEEDSARRLRTVRLQFSDTPTDTSRSTDYDPLLQFTTELVLNDAPPERRMALLLERIDEISRESRRLHEFSIEVQKLLLRERGFPLGQPASLDTSPKALEALAPLIDRFSRSRSVTPSP